MKLSIVIPIYNIEKYISKTLESLLSQTNKEFEIIAVDDGSTDGSLEIIKNIANKEKEIQIKIITQNNTGVSAARNRGLNDALGKYVIFLDGDDYVSSNMIEKIFHAIEDSESDIICWGYNHVNNLGENIYKYFDIYANEQLKASGHIFLKELFKGTYKIWTGSAAYKKSFLEINKLLYTEGCKAGEDVEFSYLAVSKAVEVYFINEILSFYLQRENSISNTFNIKKFDTVYAMKRLCDSLEQSPIKEVREISVTEKDELVIKHYFSTINSSIRNTQNVNFVFAEIDKHYPNLRLEMDKIMKNYNGGNKKLLWKIRLMRLSPTIYHFIIRLKNKT